MQESLRVRCSLGELQEGKCSGEERNETTWVYTNLRFRFGHRDKCRGKRVFTRTLFAGIVPTWEQC